MKAIAWIWGAVCAVALLVPLYVSGSARGAALPGVSVLQSLESKIAAVYFNPRELTVDKHVGWQKHKSSESDAPTLEFTSAEPKTLQVELMFDTYESGQDVYDTHLSALEAMAEVDEDLGRPPLLRFNWGSRAFEGVVTDLGVKYTLFLQNGTPVRATVNLKMKQASKLMNKSKARSAEDDGCNCN